MTKHNLTDDDLETLLLGLDVLEENLQYNDEESEDEREVMEQKIENATKSLKTIID